MGRLRSERACDRPGYPGSRCYAAPQVPSCAAGTPWRHPSRFPPHPTPHSRLLPSSPPVIFISLFASFIPGTSKCHSLVFRLHSAPPFLCLPPWGWLFCSEGRLPLLPRSTLTFSSSLQDKAGPGALLTGTGYGSPSNCSVLIIESEKPILARAAPPFHPHTC